MTVSMAGTEPQYPHGSVAGDHRSAPAADGSADKIVASAVDLAAYRPTNYSPGRGRMVRAAWYLTSLLLFEGGLFPFSSIKAGILRAFGARIGRGLVIKPRVRIKFPWRLTVGDHCWIGESAWIDNLAEVCLGDHVCVSQGVYLCTGSHDFRSRTFALITRPIQVQSGAWVAARATVLCGVSIGSNAVIAAGSVVSRDVAPGWIVGGNPAQQIKLRRDESTA
jgi:putative colanic acid biosynthesis acetyltransferase WcaF